MTHSTLMLILQHFPRTTSTLDVGSVYRNSDIPKDRQQIPEAVFLTKAVELSRNSQANVLSIGLGGGTVNGFLHYNFPEMNITVVENSAQMINLAKRWYDLQIDDHQRVVHADGVTFLKEQMEKGVKYDAVLLDACYSRPELAKTFICPVEVFLEKQVIRSIVQVVGKRGIKKKFQSSNIYEY
ncbi:hypothetical protein Y032_0462g1895 [Ancylostoma ceylanicum]|uniref:PABS domain-containing protein n=2 Tax=Ancylostoma ceylanicum TaxID=53326 RepID=A0A016WZF1_9BILA|nr:hypothetical protein Y032_0462g1895 [Ancylostoma ceylanicum]